MKDTATTLRESPQQERLILAVVGLLQGLATWIVIRIEPHEPLERAFYFGVLAWILSTGLLFQFASSGTNRLRLAIFTLCLAVPFALVSYHVVGQLQPDGVFGQGDGFRIGTWSVAGTLALYILLPHLQIYQRSAQ